MSYQVLARKWRPRTFAELIGQDHVRRALVHALREDRVHHAFLFTGTRGVGKTTIARILAKSLNCMQGVSAEPCGECSACTEIDEGRFVDLIEVDAASRTKVEDTRELLDNVQYAPTRGRYKVYLIDEVHMLSNHSFNALLKTLEEPPPHVKFLLATTDPQRLPVTILSRCLQFNLKRLPGDSIRDYLHHVASEEGVETDPAALNLLARAADGSMRDGLSLLDQAIAFGGGRVTGDDVRDMLGSVDRDHVLRLIEALAKQNAMAVFQQIQDMSALAVDFLQVVEELIEIFHRIALAQFIPDSVGDDLDGGDNIMACAQLMAPEDVQLCYQIALTGRRDLPLVPNQQSGFEMLMLRMMTFQPLDTGKDRSVRKPSASSFSGTRAPTPQVSADRGATHMETSEPLVQTIDGVMPQTEKSDWEAVVAELKLEGLVRELAANCVLCSHDESCIRLGLRPAYVHLRNDKVEKRLEKALRDYYGRGIKLVIDSADPNDATPQQLAERRDAARRQAAESDIRNDDNIRAMQELFDARIIPDSIHALD